MTGELYVFTREKDSTRMALKDVRSIEKLNGIYVRSFTIMGDEIYFVSGNSTIIRARLKDLKILEEYPVPPEIAGMVQLTKIQDYFLYNGFYRRGFQPGLRYLYPDKGSALPGQRGL